MRRVISTGQNSKIWRTLATLVSENKIKASINFRMSTLTVHVSQFIALELSLKCDERAGSSCMSKYCFITLTYALV